MSKITARKAKSPDYRAARNVIAEEMRKIAEDMVADFKSTTATWSHQPVFDVNLSLEGNVPSIEITTQDEAYGFVDQGTKAHFVAPVNAKALAFQTGYTPKTSPGIIGSTSGGASGPMAFSKGHMVSGIKPRKFSEKITDKWKSEFGKRMIVAMKLAAKATGHGKD